MPGVAGSATGNRCNLKVYAKALGEFGRLFEDVREAVVGFYQGQAEA